MQFLIASRVYILQSVVAIVFVAMCYSFSSLISIKSSVCNRFFSWIGNNSFEVRAAKSA